LSKTEESELEKKLHLCLSKQMSTQNSQSSKNSVKGQIPFGKHFLHWTAKRIRDHLSLHQC